MGYKNQDQLIFATALPLCDEFGFPTCVGIRQSKASLGRMRASASPKRLWPRRRVRRATRLGEALWRSLERYTCVCASAGDLQAAQDRRSIFRTEFATLPGEKHNWVASIARIRTMGLNTLMDILFPRACAGCGTEVGHESLYMCWNCLARLSVIHSPFCSICGNPVEGAVEDNFVCSSCVRKRPFFDIARSAAHYTGILQNLVQDFKYHNAIWLSRDFAELMIACAKAHLSEANIDAVTSVPLYHAKERERSYNQAFLLAREVTKYFHKPLVKNILCRIRPTQSQTHLTFSEREANVKNVFAVKKANLVKGSSILLIDDVMTTGATVNECSRVLKKAGAEKVSVLTLARR